MNAKDKAGIWTWIDDSTFRDNRYAHPVPKYLIDSRLINKTIDTNGGDVFLSTTSLSLILLSPASSSLSRFFLTSLIDNYFLFASFSKDRLIQSSVIYYFYWL